MSWRLSRFRTGDLVEIRSREEILATLDAEGCLNAMPFMPEMLSFCGQRFRVSAVAHKTCETAKKTYLSRRLDETVHLADLRCDGSAHGGCQADCKIFWKDAWLKRVDEAPASSVRRTVAIDEATLRAKTQLPILSESGNTRYSCQATRVYEASAPLAWWNPRQYVRDLTTRNHSIGAVARVLWIAMWRSLQHRTPVGYRAVRYLRHAMHRWLIGYDVPDVVGAIPNDQPTPTARLDLTPGEIVRIRTKEEIQQTIRQDRKNRGMVFDQEMVSYCGRTASVRKQVTQILHEDTGEMLYMKQPTIILDGVVCKGEYSQCRLLCARGFPIFWRELWLERTNEPVSGAATERVAMGAANADS